MTETITSPNLANLSIQQLRAYASHMRVPIPKTANKEEIIKLINLNQKQNSMSTLAFDGDKVPPGYVKIRILEDPSPDAANYPIYVSRNGYNATIPRGRDVIVPKGVMRVLNDATVLRRKQLLTAQADGREITQTQTIMTPSYPFQVLEYGPEGDEPLTALEQAKKKSMGPRRRYKNLFGHWPKPGDLKRAIEQRLITLDAETELLPSTEGIVLHEE